MSIFLARTFKEGLVKEMLNGGSFDFSQEEERRNQEELDAYLEYEKKKAECNEAYADYRTSEKDLKIKRKTKNDEFAVIERLRKQHERIWKEYERLLEDNDPKIRALDVEKNSEWDKMKQCFELERLSLQSGKEAEAIHWRRQAKQHQKRFYVIKEDIRQLCAAGVAKHADVEVTAPKIDSSKYQAAKREFLAAEKDFEAKFARFDTLRKERNELKDKFNAVRSEHIRWRLAHQNQSTDDAKPN